MEEYDKLRSLVTEAAEDVIKTSEGNKAAGMRVRGAMRQVREVALEVREECLVQMRARPTPER